MTVTYLGEITGSRTGSNTLGVRSYSRSFRLSTSTQSEGVYSVGSHSSLPAIGSVYPDDSSAWCRSLEVNNSDPWKGWTVTAAYSSEQELKENPTEDPAKITVSTEQFQKVAEEDINGYGIVNSAGDIFDPPHMMDDSRRVITVTKNILTAPLWLLDYADVVNNDTFTVLGITYAVGVAKIQRISISGTQVRGAFNFLSMQIDIHLRREGWLLEPLDIGFRYLSGVYRKNIVSDDGLPVTTPVMLNGSGLVLSNPTTSTAVYRSFTIYKTNTFSVIPFV